MEFFFKTLPKEKEAYQESVATSHQDYTAIIEAYQIREDQLYYTIQVRSDIDGGVKVSHKRYSDLKSMHKHLKSLVQQCNLNIELPEFPGTKLFGKTNQSSESIKIRMLDLIKYLNKLLNFEKIHDFSLIGDMFPQKNHKTMVESIDFSDVGYKKEQCQAEMDRIKQKFLSKQEFRDQYQKKKIVCFDQQYFLNVEGFEQEGVNVYYIINIRDVVYHNHWQYKARYSEFRDLHLALQEQNIKLPNFPKRQLFSSTNENISLVLTRKQHLDLYLNNVFAIPQVIASEIGLYFIKNSKRIGIKQENKVLRAPTTVTESIKTQFFRETFTPFQRSESDYNDEDDDLLNDDGDNDTLFSEGSKLM